MKHIDLFSGIGGFALAVDTVWPGSEHIFCDNDTFCQQVLKKHWPNSKIYADIRTFTNANNWGQTEQEQQATRNKQCDILTGGFPCQPFSAAGKRKGTEDNRYLWPEMFRIIRTFKPTWVIAENVRGLVTWNEGMVLEQVCTDLEGEGYEVQPLIIPAVAVNAPHRRDRIWFIAYRPAKGLERTDTEGKACPKGRIAKHDSDATNSESFGGRGGGSNEYGIEKWKFQQGKQKRNPARGKSARCSWDNNWLEVATELCGVDDEFPAGMDQFGGYTKAGHRAARLKSLGNAIVPQVAIEIMKAIKQTQSI